MCWGRGKGVGRQARATRDGVCFVFGFAENISLYGGVLLSKSFLWVIFFSFSLYIYGLVIV